MAASGQRDKFYQFINGVLVQKFPVTISTYPEIHPHVLRLVEVLESVYLIAMERGMEIQKEQPGGPDDVRIAKPPCQENTPDTTGPRDGYD